jgi:hypothetical protein
MNVNENRKTNMIIPMIEKRLAKKFLTIIFRGLSIDSFSKDLLNLCGIKRYLVNSIRF